MAGGMFVDFTSPPVGHRAKSPVELKAEANRKHFRQRVFDRYELDLDDNEIADIEARIVHKDPGCHLCRSSLKHDRRLMYSVAVRHL